LARFSTIIAKGNAVEATEPPSDLHLIADHHAATMKQTPAWTDDCGGMNLGTREYLLERVERIRKCVKPAGVKRMSDAMQ
jgi:hypothetical protein